MNIGSAKPLIDKWYGGTGFMAARGGRLGFVRHTVGVLFEGMVGVMARVPGRECRLAGGEPRSIFVLRNNDLGDVLVVTPLFEALRRRFPSARIVAGVGTWALPILEANPNVDVILPIDAPWYNKFVVNRSVIAAVGYILRSSQARELARSHFDMGIDVLGSHFGALLLTRAGIPWRLGVRGYAGGHSACRQTVDFESDEHVGRFALRFAELLGASAPLEARPQIFLSAAERSEAEARWAGFDGRCGGRMHRLVIGAGDGASKKYWPLDNYEALCRLLAGESSVQIVVVGGTGDRAVGDRLVRANSRVENLCGRLSLRQTFAVVASADAVVCNSSMLLHASAAFAKRMVVLLGPAFTSPSHHFRQWCYPGLSHYPETAPGTVVAGPRAAADLVRRLLQATKDLPMSSKNVGETVAELRAPDSRAELS